MNLIDAIYQVKRPKSLDSWTNSAPIAAICTDMLLREIWHVPDELYARFKEYPLFNWCCTDEMVGLYALYLDDAPVGAYYRSGRKMGYNFMWLSQDAVNTVRTCLVAYLQPDAVSIITPDKDTSDFPYCGVPDTRLNVDE